MLGSETTLMVTPDDKIRELTHKLARTEYLLMRAAKLIQETAPPRTATQLLMDIMEHVGRNKFYNDVLE